MKNLKYSCLLILSVFFSCSDSSEENNEIIEPVANIYEFSVNGVPAEGSFDKAQKTGHHIHLGTLSNYTDFLISFDENGNFGKIIYKYHEPITGTIKKFTSYRDFSSNYFNFQLHSFDEVNKRVKASFTGYIYYDPTNLNSESKFVSGNIDLPYEEYVPPITNLGNEATINSVPWRSTNIYQTRGGLGGYNNLTMHTMSDDPYKIMVLYDVTPGGGTLPGTTYNFTNSDITNRAQIAKYDVATSSYILYNCTGTITITNRWYFCVEGIYNLTGVNPLDSSDVLVVQNGKFKLNYNPN